MVHRGPDVSIELSRVVTVIVMVAPSEVKNNVSCCEGET